MVELDERSKKILLAIIQSYIDLNEPIGSRMVTERFSFGLSPATIRNTMAELNESGYLTQPHTSAGRIPTERGYRLYVDSLSKDFSLCPNKTFLQYLSNKLRFIEKDINKLIEEISKTLSTISHYVGIAMQPRSEEIVLKRIEIIRHKNNSLLCLLISEGGIVKNKTITWDDTFSQKDLCRIVKYLNHELTGLPFKEIKKKIISQISKEKTACDKLISNALRICREAIMWATDYNYSGEISGTRNLPEFATMAQVKKIFQAIEDKHLIVKLLDKISDSQGVQVFIGSENILPEMRDFSVVVSTYYDGRAPGTIGIIGPTRMNYEHIIPIVDQTAKTLTEILLER